MTCDRCLGRSVLTFELERVAKDDDVQQHGATLAAVRARCLASGVTPLCLCDDAYPAGVRQLNDPPPVLYVRGDARLVSADYERAVGIVGTRRPTRTGREAARQIAAGYASAGGVVVSGLALGIDGAAHDGALSVGGLTIAVLAGGVDRASPSSHTRLYDRILEHGAVVSELPPGTPPRRWTFPARNRLIAALSGAVLVVEAPERSGALITVRHANDLGRDVCTVPGSTMAPTCAGSNALLLDGAIPVLDGRDFAATRGLTMLGCAPPAPPGGPAAEVHEELRLGARTPAELAARATSLEPAELELVLLELELGGWVVRRADGRYAAHTA